MSTIKIAVITGGHNFDVQPFHQLFRLLSGVDAYIQHTDEFVSETAEVRDSYDAFVFYSMFKDTPTDDVAWYAGKPKTALERLGETKQGIILLHHALLAYPDWPMWDDIAGMRKRIMRSYHQNEQVAVDIADSEHPIAKGMASWKVIDETYILDNAVMPEAVPGNRIFLTTQHPRSMQAFGWTRQYKQARVFCFPSGHGYATYANPNFQTVLHRGIEWVTGHIT
ncbi:MAG: ThuA domain-containing protein [Anaerolineae bacterium]|nr:ThuA domain-containing protein [Anaerolineae bacterium]